MEENIIMKKTLFIFATLLMTAYCVADDNLVGNKAPQDKNIQKQGVVVKNYEFQQGDTILISEDTKPYLSGEEISNWVYYVRHIVQQNGGKRFPNGILIQGINSWVEPSGLLLLHAQEQTPEAVKKQEEDKTPIKRQEQVQPVKEEKAQPVKEEKVQPVKEETVIVPPVIVEEEKTQPDKEEKAQPVKEEKAQPVKEEKAQPVKEEKAQPVKEEKAQPVKEEKAQPVKEEEVPVKEQTIKDEPVETVPAIVSQIDRFSIGLRGGVASMMHKTMTLNTANGAWKPGFDVILDLQYAHYWQQGTAPQVGILTGLSVGYNRSTVVSQYDSISNIMTDMDGDNVRYHWSGKATEKDGQVMLEVPLMFSMVTLNGFFMNIGPRVQVPVFNHYNQTITDGVITLENITKGVSVTNEPVTGALGNKEVTKGTQKMSTINVLLSAELGYEFKLKNNNSIGLGVYANYGVYSLYKNEAGKQLFNVTLPTGGDAPVNVFTTTQAYTQNNALGFFDCGLKLNYNFDWVRR